MAGKARARRIFAWICNERATQPGAKRTRQVVQVIVHCLLKSEAQLTSIAFQGSGRREGESSSRARANRAGTSKLSGSFTGYASACSRS
jgi:hypothetical protein